MKINRHCEPERGEATSSTRHPKNWGCSKMRLLCRRAPRDNRKKHFVSALSIIVFTLFLPVISQAREDAGAVFRKANAYYQQEKYEEAITEYKKILDSGQESGNLYYNIGNSYMKSGDLGRAVLNYKRAERLMPGDSDLAANLKYAGSVMHQSAFVQEKNGVIAGLLSRLSRGRSVDGLTRWVLALYMCLFATGVLAVLLKSARRAAVRAIFVFGALFLISAASLIIKINYENEAIAIVLAGQEEAKFEPFENATTHFSVYQGQAAVIIKKEGGWVLIRRNDGKSGWVKADTVEKL